MADNAHEDRVAAQRRQSRIIYGVLAALMALFLLWDVRLPFVVGPQAQSLYDAVEKAPDDKLVLLSLNWSMGTTGENWPQTEGLIQHLFMTKQRFAIFGIDPVGPTLGQQIAEKHAARFGAEYGRDWVNFGYRPGQTPMFLGLARDIPGTIKQDVKGNDVSKLPVMAGIRSARDLGLILEVTPSATLDIWIQFFHGPYSTPVGYAPTAVMAPEAYPLLDTGQIVGMLAGIKGAAEYAALLEKRPGGETLEWYYQPTRAINAISIAHVLIVVLIVLGNYQYFVSRRRREVEL